MSEGSNWPRLTSSSPGANVCFAIPSTKRIVANGWPFAFCAGVQRSVSEPSDSSTPRKSCGAGTSGSTLPNVPPVSPPPAGGGAGTPTMNVIENALELPAASRTVPASVCVPFASAPVLKVAVGPEIVGAAAAAPSSVTPVSDAMSSLAVIAIWLALATIAPFEGTDETTIGMKLSTRIPPTRLWLVFPTASVTTARRS